MCSCAGKGKSTMANSVEAGMTEPRAKPSGWTAGTFHFVDPDRIPATGLRFVLDPQWSGIPTRSHCVRVHDAGALPEAPQFERQGFELVTTDVEAVDARDPEQIERLWRPAMCRAVRALTGADAVASWAFGARFSERRSDVMRGGSSNPARRVHGDYSPTEFGTEFLHPPAVAAIAEVAPGRRFRRWIGVNVWQAVSPPPYDTPLALCDTRTVAADDLIIGRGSAPAVPGFEVDLPLYRFNEHHRWYAYRAMQRDQALLFCGLDSAVPGDWRLVPHTAFDDPSCPPNAPPRASIEMRTLALFFA
jgi:hypothetical protein